MWVTGWVGARAAGRAYVVRETSGKTGGVCTGSEKYMLSFHPGNAAWAVLPR